MSDKRALLVICLALGLLSASLRFFCLGAWPFAGDELATLAEAQSLVTQLDGPPTSQLDRIPRLLAPSSGLHYVAHELFGRDEFGAGVLAALLGTLHVLLVFLLLDKPLVRVPALATALLIAL